MPPPPPGRYSHACIVEAGRLMVVPGQIAVDRRGNVIGPGDFTRQFDQVYRNLGAILKEYGAAFRDVVQFTTYLSRQRPRSAGVPPAPGPALQEDLSEGDYPANTLLVIDRLVLEDLLLEIEALVALD